MPTAAEMVCQFVEKKGLLTVQAATEQLNEDGSVRRHPSIGLQLAVTIHDARTAHGNVHLLVRPIVGVGTVWVDSTRVRVIEQWPVPTPEVLHELVQAAKADEAERAGSDAPAIPSPSAG